ncbi:methyl-accepting chemotaxis protein [Bacillus sp. EB01]|uniref:methyl-accepting chemotaxis protein n=1 Tax=Bacillus sp. EB01 TaxID=1347086 RepID=UPI0005C4A4A5|nr:methyl-accepting chemotaxis protein [Bacillus sp. EB01]
MKWYLNLKIRWKLIWAFVTLYFFTVVVSAIGVISLKHSESDYNHLYDAYGIATADMGRANNNFNDLKAAVMELFITEDKQEKEKTIARIQDLSEEIDRNLTAVGSSIEGEEMSDTFNSLTETFKDYDMIRIEVVGLVLENKNNEARDLNNTEGIQAANEIGHYFDVALQLKSEEGKKLTNELRAQTGQIVIYIISAAVIAFLLGVIMAIFIIRNIRKPIEKMVETAEQIAEGNLDVQISINTKDEIGALASAFRKMSNNLNQTMLEIQTAADQVASGSRQISESSISLSQGATEQASSVEQLSATVEEISAQTKHNADHASEANRLAEITRQSAEEGNTRMNEMLKAMDDIHESSESIFKIIKVIDEIAFQTNILALNAAVEAARAGQHGKGFAVVADEVRSLAARSAKAAKETSELIEGSIRKADGGMKIADETATALEKILEDIAKVATHIHDISVASNEQSIGISQINQGIMQVSQVIQSNSATSEQGAVASEQLSNQAEALRSKVGQFKLKNTINKLGPEQKSIGHLPQQEVGNALAQAAVARNEIDLNENEIGKY